MKLIVKKKWIIVGSIIAIVIILGIVIYFLGGLSDGLFSSPVDTSGINISSDLASEELLPGQLIDNSHALGNTVPGSISWYSEGQYSARTIEAEYNGITLRVWKSETEALAQNAFTHYYEEPFDFFYSGSKQKTRTPLWFTFEGDGVSGFVWRSGVWVFGVEAGDAQTRNQAASEWVQELRNK